MRPEIDPAAFEIAAKKPSTSGPPATSLSGALEGKGDELIDSEPPPLTEDPEGALSMFIDHSMTHYMRVLTEIRDASA